MTDEKGWMRRAQNDEEVAVQRSLIVHPKKRRAHSSASAKREKGKLKLFL